MTKLAETALPYNPTIDCISRCSGLKALRSFQINLPSRQIANFCCKPPVCHSSFCAWRPKQVISQPANWAFSAKLTSALNLTCAPSNKIFSCGSHSKQAPCCKLNCRSWLACWPLALYHLPAPGVVSKACAPLARLTFSVSASPPATPPGG